MKYADKKCLGTTQSIYGYFTSYTPTPLEWDNGVTSNPDFRFTASVTANQKLCGVKLGSNDWTNNGVTSLWMKWCDKTTWSLQTEGRLWENQQAKDFGGYGKENMYFGESDCDSDQCAGNLVCIERDEDAPLLVGIDMGGI